MHETARGARKSGRGGRHPRERHKRERERLPIPRGNFSPQPQGRGRGEGGRAREHVKEITYPGRVNRGERGRYVITEEENGRESVISTPDLTHLCVTCDCLLLRHSVLRRSCVCSGLREHGTTEKVTTRTCATNTRARARYGHNEFHDRGRGRSPSSSSSSRSSSLSSTSNGSLSCCTAMHGDSDTTAIRLRPTSTLPRYEVGKRLIRLSL